MNREHISGVVDGAVYSADLLTEVVESTKRSVTMRISIDKARVINAAYVLAKAVAEAQATAR